MGINLKIITGYAYGAIQPTVLFQFPNSVAISATLRDRLKELRACLSELALKSQFDTAERGLDLDSLPALIVSTLDLLNCHCGDQRFTPIKVIDNQDVTEIAFPTLSPQMVHFNMISIQTFIRNDFGESSEKINAFLTSQLAKCRRFLPNGTNVENFIAAAAERKLPFKILSERFVIFGYGSGSNIFSSSITDRESAIGVSLAGSKADTNRLLKMAGFPVAEQRRVTNVGDAVRSANDFGYPVVLKPENEEQGRGVYANILDDEELQQNFEKCSSVFNSLLLEKHIPGDIYRANVVNGKVVRVVKRTIAEVVGDGRSTVSDLIDVFNQDPDIKDPTNNKKAVVIDDEVLTVIKKQGHSPDSTPLDNERVRLTSTANMSRGGSAENFIDRFHEANFKLTLDVAETMRLKVSGIDIISKDASKPWHKNGAVICEVNAQPQLTRKMYKMHDIVLEEFCPKSIPITLIVTNGQNREGIADAIFDKSMKSLQLILSAEEIFQNGCPTQYFDSVDIAADLSEAERVKLDRMLVSVMPDAQ